MVLTARSVGFFTVHENFPFTTINNVSTRLKQLNSLIAIVFPYFLVIETIKLNSLLAYFLTYSISNYTQLNLSFIKLLDAAADWTQWTGVQYTGDAGALRACVASHRMPLLASIDKKTISASAELHLSTQQQQQQQQWLRWVAGTQREIWRCCQRRCPAPAGRPAALVSQSVDSTRLIRVALAH